MRVRYNIMNSMIDDQPFPKKIAFHRNVTSLRRLFALKLLAVKA